MKNFLSISPRPHFFPAALTAQEENQSPTRKADLRDVPRARLCPLAELEAYKEKAIAEKLGDQQVRDNRYRARPASHRHGLPPQARQARPDSSPNTTR